MVTATVLTGEGTAVGSRDYSEVNREILFPFGVSEMPLQIPVSTANFDGEATFTLKLDAGTGCTVSEQEAVVTLVGEKAAQPSENTAVLESGSGARGSSFNSLTSVRTLESVATEDGVVHPGSGYTGIYITPGYRYKAVDALITNFHLPESTLLMLVSAFVGREEVLRVYAHAVEQRYRFFSFGDACLFE